MKVDTSSHIIYNDLPNSHPGCGGRDSHPSDNSVAIWWWKSDEHCGEMTKHEIYIYIYIYIYIKVNISID